MTVLHLLDRSLLQPCPRKSLKPLSPQEPPAPRPRSVPSAAAAIPTTPTCLWSSWSYGASTTPCRMSKNPRMKPWCFRTRSTRHWTASVLPSPFQPSPQPCAAKWGRPLLHARPPCNTHRCGRTWDSQKLTAGVRYEIKIRQYSIKSRNECPAQSLQGLQAYTKTYKRSVKSPRHGIFVHWAARWP